jgi:dihydrofolate synthase/folylpolyglutamate synthase
MDYMEAVLYISSTSQYGSKLGLDNIRILLDLMKNPQKSLKCIHVAGTNGKGSTSAFISSILQAAGYMVGTFNSPFIERFTEQIKLNGKEIENDELVEITEFIREKALLMYKDYNVHPTEFEITTAIAFEYFYRKHCDLAVIEVGLGGREDATNIIDTPEVAVITTINFDHMQWLGKTLPDIALQKAGIIKENGTVVLYPQIPEVEQVFLNICAKKKAKVFKINKMELSSGTYDINYQVFSYKDFNDLKIKLLGDHQLLNAATAIETCLALKEKGYAINESHIFRGLEDSAWPGRLEVLGTDPIVLIDGAHNKEGGQALKVALDKYFKDTPKVFVVGFLRDKEYNEIIQNIAKKDDIIITLTPNNCRAITSGQLCNILRKKFNNVFDGVTAQNGLKLNPKQHFQRD